MSKVKKHRGPKGLKCSSKQRVKMVTPLGRTVWVDRCKTFKKPSK